MNENSGREQRVLVGSIQKFSTEDGPGIRTTIFLKGCPLNCRWCHNPELIEYGQQLIRLPNNCIGCGYCVRICPRGAVTLSPREGVVIDREKCDVCLKCADNCYAKALKAAANPMTAEEILCAAEQDKGFYDHTGGGITLSGGEILTHAETAARLIEQAAGRGIDVCIDTCGYGDGQILMDLALRENVTHILYDMKSVDDDIHRAYTGVSNRRILENLRMLAADSQTREKLILRMPLIKGVNDSMDIIRRTGELYREIGVSRVELLPYHNFGISKKRNLGGAQEEFCPPDEERITEIETYFKKELHFDIKRYGKG